MRCRVAALPLTTRMLSVRVVAVTRSADFAVRTIEIASIRITAD
jgi:hypothetical protein